ncbi:MAG TPA: efflux RND transporter periplasmic adaptor subunit [Caulobacteraceae bacterium]|nr:efflux RND transporter periplasmic adaptor subunit [Caulobacteraceae bacterium]
MRVLRGLAAAALALAASGALVACGSKAAPPDPEAGARTVRVATIAVRPLTGGLESSGILVSREEAAVNAEQLLSGYRVLKVFVEPDATVVKGQPLVQLDDTLLRSQIAQAEAQVAAQRVAAAQADQQAADVAGLDKQGVLSKEQIDQRRFAAQGAHASLAAQTAVLRDLQSRDARMIIRAPVAGLVLTRNVRPGDVASASATSPMFTIARDSLVELQAQVAEGDMAGIHVGDAVQVKLPDGSTVNGSVRLVEPAIDPQTKLGKVHIRLPVQSNLRPGGFGRALFTGLVRTVPVAPEVAIRYDADGASVMQLDASNHVHQAPVKTGEHEGGYVEIVQGPPAGSRVLLGASAFVLPGDVVRPIPADAGSGS